MQIPIKRTVERTPGGIMVIPLLAGCIIATFAPDLPKFFGSFTAALFSGALWPDFPHFRGKRWAVVCFLWSAE
jgi:hypothetical protein